MSATQPVTAQAFVRVVLCLLHGLLPGCLEAATNEFQAHYASAAGLDGRTSTSASEHSLFASVRVAPGVRKWIRERCKPDFCSSTTQDFTLIYPFKSTQGFHFLVHCPSITPCVFVRRVGDTALLKILS